jgi:hypothetical protein
VFALTQPSASGSAAILVDERVGQDAEEPSLEVGAGVKLVTRAHRLDEGVLHQVLGVRRVARQLARDAVHRVEVRERLLGERVLRRLRRFGKGRVHGSLVEVFR